VAPPLILYFWALQDMRSAAWISVLVYAVCCVVRLARFNVSDKIDKSEENAKSAPYFTGVPSPAGALLVLLPMTISFAFHNRALVPDVVICLHMVLIGFLMISRIPTWSFKTTKVSRAHVKYLLVGVAVFGAALLTYAWITLVVLCVAYITMVLWGLTRRAKPVETQED
jgi:CDP-diacylglycerol--serine O-phosphatidyltransferase